MELDGKKVLVTGVTGMVAEPIAAKLAAAGTDVIGIARFNDAAARKRLEDAGVTCETVDLAGGDLGNVPKDVDVVLHFAVAKSFTDADFDAHLVANAEATGLLMEHCRDVDAFLHCSSTAVYQPNDHAVLDEDAPLGDNHRSLMPTYSITKIATEAVVRTCARLFGIPTTIARLNVPYGERGGWPAFHLAMILGGHPVPVHPNAPSAYTPIHEDDMLASIPALLDAASVPATVVNWAGHQTVSIEEWCAYFGELVGKEPTFVESPQALESVIADTARLRALGVKTTVDWRDGFRRLAQNLHPEALR